MAYIVMTYAVMAYIVMAYIVMACSGNEPVRSARIYTVGHNYIGRNYT